MTQTENRAVGHEHTVSVVGRERITVTGVSEVLSFDESSVVMDTSAGSLTLDGDELNITKLDLENATVLLRGRLLGMYYIEPRGKRKLFGR